MDNDYEVVFVQLGKAKASHLWKNIISIQSCWPELKITLITDSVDHIRKAKKGGISWWSYTPDKELSELISKSSHNKLFREGFWNYSLLRLFAVLDYSLSNPGKVLVHLESDITIFPNFPFGALSSRKLPTWLRFNETHDVGSIFTIPNSITARWLKSVFILELTKNPDLTDMTLLNCVSRKYGDLIEFLPVADCEAAEYLRPDVRDSQEARVLSKSFRDFNGIFDSAPIGMWLLGQDPRNHLGNIIRYRNLPESYIQPQLTTFAFQNQTKTISTIDGIQVFNLHVHSKELGYFDGRRAKEIKMRISESLNHVNEVKFSFVAFTKLTWDYIKRNGIFSVPSKLKTFLNLFFNN